MLVWKQKPIQLTCWTIVHATRSLSLNQNNLATSQSLSVNLFACYSFSDPCVITRSDYSMKKNVPLIDRSFSFEDKEREGNAFLFFFGMIPILAQYLQLWHLLSDDSTRLVNAASMSSKRMRLCWGATASKCASRSSVSPRSLKFMTHIPKSSSPASAVINEDLPQPGGPCRR